MLKDIKTGDESMYPMKPNNWLKHADFMIIDILCLQLALFQAYLLRHGAINPYSIELYRTMSFVFIMIDCIIEFFAEDLKNVLKRGYYKEFKETSKHVIYVILGGVFYLFAIKESTNYSRSTLLIAAVIYMILSYCTRILWKSFLNLQKTNEKNLRATVIITTKSTLEEVVNSIQHNDYPNLHIVGIGIMDGPIEIDRVNDIPVLSEEKEILEYICRGWVDEIFIQVPEGVLIPESMLFSFNEMAVTVHTKLLNTVNVTGQYQFVERMGPYTVLTTSVKMVSQKQLFFKRFLDICGGLIGCLISGILFLFVAPCIRILSPGPVIFSQVRVGRNGKRFKIYKFRSMCLNAEEKKKEMMKDNMMGSEQISKFQNDSRIIGSEKGEGKGFGNFIRKYSIDEFPQFINVLKGDMSLVGTRPPTEDEWQTYDLHHRARLAVKPGITGMWQVNGRSKVTDFEKIVDLDKRYIAEWSVALDLRILLRTVKVVLGKEGSM